MVDTTSIETKIQHNHRFSYILDVINSYSTLHTCSCLLKAAKLIHQMLVTIYYIIIDLFF